jgi:Icc-related predicted phosphoesterase
MQILLVSDLHYTLRQFDWVVSVAGDYDLVVVAGDLLDIGSIVEPDAQIAVVLEYLARIAAKTTTAVCSGNHDLNATNQVGERAAGWLEAAQASGVWVDGMQLNTDDVAVTVCPWWDGPRTRDLIDAQLSAAADLVGAREWVWVYHGPPDGSPTSWTGKRHYGDEALVDWIAQYQPAYVLCGHVHQSPFVADGNWIDRVGSTLVFNAGRQIGPVPTHITLETGAGRAEWFSLAGDEERSLAEV